MSLKPVPACNICNRCTEVSISCTNCYQTCCATCFNLRNDSLDVVTRTDDNAAVRICSKCCDDMAIKQEPTESVCTETLDRRWEACALHGKARKLFCMNCMISICGDCLGDKEEHEMHHIDNMVVVYREKFAEVEQKLVIVEKMVAGSSVYENNLEMIEKEEQSILNEVSAMTADAISDLTCQTAKRKAVLKQKIDFLADKRIRLTELLGTVNQLTAEEFLTQRSEIERKCHDMMEGDGLNFTLERVDDFKCDLVPAYKFAKFTCAGFATASSNYVFKMHSAHDVTWTMNVNKLPMLQFKFSPSDSGISKFFHKLVVVISHEDPAKEIRKTFNLGGNFHTFEIVEMAYLEEHGFFTATGGLMLKIGIRPLNVVVEKMLLQHNCHTFKGEISKLKNQMNSITNGFEYKYHSAHLKVSMKKLEASNAERFGTIIMDDEGRQWNLKVLPTMVYQRPTQIEAYIYLLKGSNTNCRYFIELKHKKATKLIVKSETKYFNRREVHGWKCFITWSELNDAGFHPDGNLLFRYGIKPLKN